MYGKLFTQMYDGTLATKGPWQALVTFQQLIILADKHGVVDMTPEAISRRTTIPLEIIQDGIKNLQEDDPASRTPTENGKRIVPLSENRDWGWQIVNYAHYRKIRSAEERKEYHAKYMKKWRETKVNKSDDVNPKQPIAVSSMQEAVSIKTKGTAQAPFVLPDWVPQDHWRAWVEARTKARKAPTDYAKRLAVLKLENLKEQGYAPAQVLMASAFNGWSGLFPPKEIK